MAKKRSCRRTNEENAAHAVAVRIRKMTDMQITEYMEEIRKKAYEEASDDAKDAGKAICESCDRNVHAKKEPTAQDFIDVLKKEKIPGIGAVTISKLLEVAKRYGFIQPVTAR